MEGAATYDPQDEEFYKQFFLNRLRPIALILCQGNMDRAMDLLQDTAKWFYDWKPWLHEGLSTFDNSLRYTTVVMKRLFAKEAVEDPLANAVGLQEVIISESPRKLFRNQYLVERRSLGVKALRLFKDDKQMQIFICLRFFSNMTRAEISDEMNLDPREITDLGRRFRYRIRREKGFKVLGLAATRRGVRALQRKKNDSWRD
jgi:hypothetical protein